MIFEILCAVLGIISIFLIMLVYYSLKRIAMYEEIILQVNDKIEYVNQQLKLIDDKGHFEADDEVGFFFEEIKLLSSQLDELFEPLDEVVDENKKKEKK